MMTAMDEVERAGTHAAPPGDATAGAGAESHHSVADVVKPHLRGWIHAGMAPVALVAGIVLVALAPVGPARTSSIVFAVATVLLFTTSAVYHRGTWSAPVTAALRRLDHSNILLVIAGTYTPLAVLLLSQSTATWLLATIWGATIAGIAARVFWLTAPRWFYVPLYVVLGLVSVAFLPAFWARGGPAIVWLLLGGGLAYVLGAVVYGIKRPNPSPRWFGFHEVFHVLTVVGYAAHYLAVAIATTTAR
jgi:hemolysin III